MFLGFFVGAETTEAEDVLVVRDALNGTSEMSTGKCFEFFCFICIFLEKKKTNLCLLAEPPVVEESNERLPPVVEESQAPMVNFDFFCTFNLSAFV